MESSKSSGQNGQAQKKNLHIVNGDVVVKKKTSISKVKDSIIAEDFKDVIGVVLEKTVFPWVKKGLHDVLTNTIDMIIYGEISGNKTTPSNVSKISYNGYYNGTKTDSNNYVNLSPNKTLFDDIVYGSMGAAQEVLDSMQDSIETYGNVSIAEMYEIASVDIDRVSVPWTANGYGWKNISSAKIVPCSNPDGYIIRFPRPIPIN